MAVPIITSSADAGAPKFSGTLGAAIPVFDYILIQKLGWEKVFSGLNKAVYRPPAGKRRFYRIDDTGGSAQGHKKYKITMYETMSDVDTGVGASASFYGYKSNTLDTVQKGWIAIGDSAGVHIRVQFGTSSDLQQELTYIGDGVPIFSDDEWLSMVTGRATDDVYISNYGYLSSPAAVSGVANHMCLCRKRDGTVGSVYAGVIPGGGMLVGGEIMGSTAVLPSSSNFPVDGKLLYTRPAVNDGSVRSIRGYLPGLYCSEHGSGLTDKQVYPDGDKALMALRICPSNNVNSNMGWVFIDVGEGFRS